MEPGQPHPAASNPHVIQPHTTPTPTHTPAAPKALSQNACLPCRSVKMKCRRDPSSAICERCIRKSMDCVFEKHRRGRKPGTRLVRKTQDQVSPVGPPDESRAGSSRWQSEATSSVPDDSVIEPGLRDAPPVIYTGGPAASLPGPKHIWDESSALQPAELLHKNAKTGKFSLQNVLSTTDASDQDDGGDVQNNGTASVGTATFSLDDPIRCKILNFPIALGLFDSFMRSLNPFISQFDPQLHTFEYVQQRSPFLLTSILAAAARAFHPPLHPQLRAHTEQLLAKAFTQGTKSPETVQAILVSTYWKEPDDTRSWLLIGYAIRMCIEMGWHKLEPTTAESREGETELQVREARNCRRTWLILFVYDRSISLQVGKPCMIEQNDFITTAQDWYKQPFAVFGADALLCAFVTLRIISSEIVELVSPDRSARHIQQSDTLMKLLNSNITRWEEYWHPISDDDRVDRCQAFLIRFYGTHLRLLLNSYSLQNSLQASKNGTPISKQAVWTCYSAAIDMLKQISDRFGPLKLLYFAQDSVHVMTAYSAVFLIKLLLSLPSHLSHEFETSSIEAIRKTAQTFESQCATQKTGCALQARFLNNVAVQYEKAKRQVKPNGPTSETKTIAPPQFPMAQSAQQVEQNMSYPDTAMMGNQPMVVGTGQEEFYPPMGYDNEMSAWTFENNDRWEEMFATAGYRIYDGVFVPDDAMGNGMDR
ncbi:fungal specific transcription factor domain-containing protein [Phlyctema vagabunda]|uniref:Fungal specific transcription factor domain-containing protein n=1 Tax=Phlyctema vagabunda TaxID=108571 RepID=A0ABR4P874_9HELO